MASGLGKSWCGILATAGMALLQFNGGCAWRTRQAPAALAPAPVPYREIVVGTATRPPRPAPIRLPHFPEGAIFFIGADSNGNELFFDTGSNLQRIVMHQPTAIGKLAEAHAEQTLVLPDNAQALRSHRTSGQLLPHHDAQTLHAAAAAGQLRTQAGSGNLRSRDTNANMHTEHGQIALRAAAAVGSIEPQWHNYYLQPAAAQSGAIDATQQSLHLRTTADTGQTHAPAATTAQLNHQHRQTTIRGSTDATAHTLSITAAAALPPIAAGENQLRSANTTVPMQSAVGESVTKSLAQPMPAVPAPPLPAADHVTPPAAPEISSPAAAVTTTPLPPATVYAVEVSRHQSAAQMALLPSRTATLSTHAATAALPLPPPQLHTIARTRETATVLRQPPAQDGVTPAAAAAQMLYSISGGDQLSPSQQRQGVVELPPVTNVYTTEQADDFQMHLHHEQAQVANVAADGQVRMPRLRSATVAQHQGAAGAELATAVFELPTLQFAGNEYRSTDAAVAAATAAGGTSGAKPIAAMPVIEPRQLPPPLPPVQGQPFFGLNDWQLGERISAHNLLPGFFTAQNQPVVNNLVYIPPRSVTALERSLERGIVHELLYGHRRFSEHSQPRRLNQSLRILYPDYQQNVCHGAEFIIGVELRNTSSENFERSLLCLRLPANSSFVEFTAEVDRAQGFIQTYCPKQQLLVWKLFQPLAPGQRFQAYVRLRAAAWR